MIDHLPLIWPFMLRSITFKKINMIWHGMIWHVTDVCHVSTEN